MIQILLLTVVVAVSARSVPNPIVPGHVTLPTSPVPSPLRVLKLTLENGNHGQTRIFPACATNGRVRSLDLEMVYEVHGPISNMQENFHLPHGLRTHIAKVETIPAETGPYLASEFEFYSEKDYKGTKTIFKEMSTTVNAAPVSAGAAPAAPAAAPEAKLSATKPAEPAPAAATAPAAAPADVPVSSSDNDHKTDLPNTPTPPADTPKDLTTATVHTTDGVAPAATAPATAASPVAAADRPTFMSIKRAGPVLRLWRGDAHRDVQADASGMISVKLDKCVTKVEMVVAGEGCTKDEDDGFACGKDMK